MFDEGQAVGLGVMWPVEIYGQWHTLAATASSWAAESSAAAEQMESAAVSWTGLVSSYREAETQEIVRTALDEAPEVTRQWADVTGRAADVLQGFATEANGLQQQAAALEGQASRLQARLWVSGLFTGGGGGEDTSAEDDVLRGEIEVHNSDVMALNSRWEQLEQQTASEIDSIAGGGGYQDEIPVINTGGATFGPAAGGLGAGGFGAGGALDLGVGLGFGFQSAVAQMIRSGNDPGTGDPVETAQDLFEQVISEDASGEDVQNFRDHLAEMDASEIQEFSEQTPAVHENSIPQPRSEEQYQHWPSGQDGNEWWSDLGEAGQAAMMAHLPLMVGNVQGVPYKTRDTANRDALQRLKDNSDYNEWDENLRRIDQALTRSPGGEEPMLLSLDIGERAEAQLSNAPGNNEPHGWERQPFAAISVGDPDTADTTTFGASGMGSGTHKMQEEVTLSEQLRLDLEQNGDGSHAVVSWVGYDPPAGLMDQGDSASVWRDDRATAGGWDFAYALDGFQETRTAEGDDLSDFTVNVHAHSYGTNMSAHALTRIDHLVDTFSMYGSSGIPESVAEHASEFEVAVDGDGQPMVFASESMHDGTARWGRLIFLPRQDPTAEDFGAREYYSGHEHEGDVTNLADVTGHYRVGEDPDEIGYLDRDSAHYRHLTYIFNGKHHNILTTEEYSEDWVPMDDVLRDHYRSSSGS